MGKGSNQAAERDWYRIEKTTKRSPSVHQNKRLKLKEIQEGSAGAAAFLGKQVAIALADESGMWNVPQMVPQGTRRK